MARLAFFVLTGPFTAGEHGTFTDSVEIDDAPPELVRLASHAHAAGVLDVTDGLDLSDVESQEDGEARLAEAMGEWVPPQQRPDGTAEPGYWTGPWQAGNVAQHDLDAAHRDVAAARDSGDDDEVERAEARLARLSSEIEGRLR